MTQILRFTKANTHIIPSHETEMNTDTTHENMQNNTHLYRGVLNGLVAVSQKSSLIKRSKTSESFSITSGTVVQRIFV